MKICTLQTIISLVLCSLAVAHDNYGQVLDKKITVTLREASLEEALYQIEKLVNVKFFYSLDQLNVTDKISLEAVDSPLRAVLAETLAPLGIQYKVHEKKSTITLKKQHHQTESDGEKKNDQFHGVVHSYPGSLVTGNVTDAATKQPMAGVNVIIKGTTQGTSTDSDGNYNIWADDSDVLVFSFIGYKTIETQINGRSKVDLAMDAEVAALGQVIINAGYYDVKQKEKTGNISRVTREDIQKQPVQNPLAALQGRIPGLEITQSTGVPGGNFKVRIRGTNSIANGNNPLFIINGIPYTSTTMAFNETSSGIFGNALSNGGTNPLNAINPSDIESIEVLKDADATAIYGSRGSNGVILITTRKGKPGKTNVNLNFYTGGGKVTRMLDLLHTNDYLTMRKEAFLNDGSTPTVSNARDLLVFDTTRYTDWQKELIGGTAQTTDAQASVSGGDQYTQFSLGLGYHRETTVFPGDNSDQRVSAHLNVTNAAYDEKLKINVSANYSAGNSDLLNQDLTARALFLPPNAPAIFDQEGGLNWVGWTNSGNLENPLSVLRSKYESNTRTLITSLDASYALLPNLEIKSRLGYINTHTATVNLVPISSLAPALAATALNTTDFSNSSFHNWMVEPQLNWTPKFGAGKLDLLIATQFLNQVTEGLAQRATGFVSEALMRNIGAAPTRTNGTNYYNQYRYHAIFGRLNYTFSDKYIINITGRRDGSSRFGPGKQFANFGAVGAGWIFSNENLGDVNSFLSFGKLRGSYGITGNDQLTDYQYLDAYSPSPGAYQGVIGLTPVRLSNPDFAWETNKKFETAIELGFWQDRILTSVSLYRNRSSNQLVGYPLPPTAGFNSIQSNFPATVQNTGTELEIIITSIRQKHFKWTTSLNVTLPRNKLLEFPNLENSPTYANTYVVGQPLSIAKLYHSTGIDATTGIYQVEDVNEDGTFDTNDRQTIRFIGADFYGGFQNNVSYRGFLLDIFFQFAKQDGRNYLYTTGTPGFIGNQPEVVLDRWQELNDNTNTQRFGRTSTTSSAYQRIQSSDKSVSDASFIRLKNISLSYTFLSEQTNEKYITNARIFIQGQNLLTITGYEGLDPEAQGSFLPPLRVLTCGFSLNF